MKIRVSIILVTLLIISNLFMGIASAAKEAKSEAPQIQLPLTAQSAVLMDGFTGKVIYENNSHLRLPPASITKIMTLLLIVEALENGKIRLKDQVTASENACSMGGSQIWLEPGEAMGVDELIHAIAIGSANDACVAMAEHLAGSEEAFVDLMNKRAKELGMDDTTFKNTNGLPAEGHVTSAHDIALMSKEGLKHPKFVQLVSTREHYLRDGKLWLVNTNRLLGAYKGSIGVKTGWTNEAKYCLSAAAERDGLRLISVVMGVDNSKVRFKEASDLLNQGFRMYVAVNMAKSGDVFGEVAIRKGLKNKVRLIAENNLAAAVLRGEESGIAKKVVINSKVTAPVKRGQILGKVFMMKNGEKLGEVNLVADYDVKKANIFQIFLKLIKNIFSKLFEFAVI